MDYKDPLDKVHRRREGSIEGREESMEGKTKEVNR